MPYKVLVASELEWVDKVVYGMLALTARKCKPVSVGVRLIAKELGCGKSTVSRSIGNLVREGFLIKTGGRGERAKYELTSWVFKHVDRRDEGEVRVTQASGVPIHCGTVPAPSRPIKSAPKGWRAKQAAG
jgi:DNA-binding transcriptional MocR family regulator